MWEELSVYVVPILVAALVGALIGFEREYRDKSAGLRTMLLIAIGSCLFTILSSVIGGGEGESSRIAASIVTGIGFLGAGAILKEGINIRGLTTAASIWLVASLGMAVGVGMYEVAGVVTLLAMIIMWALPPLERLLDGLHEFIEVNITVKNSDAAEDEILDIFDEYKIKIAHIRRTRTDKSERTMHITAKLNAEKRKALSEILVNEKDVLQFSV